MGLDNPLHIVFLVVILLLVFGARRLPEIGRSLGSGMREFKQSVTGESHSQQPALPAGEKPQSQQVQQAPAPAPVAQPAAAQTPVAAPAQTPVAAPAQAPVAQPTPSQAGAGEGEQRD
jgi:sec-independent protein translocase protein TatA